MAQSCRILLPVVTFDYRLDVVKLNMTSPNNLRFAVKHLYKQLLYLGKEYPMGEEYFKSKLKQAFMKNKDETDPEKIKMLIARGEYVIKEVEALYMLRKYRTLKQRYYGDNNKK